MTAVERDAGLDGLNVSVIGPCHRCAGGGPWQTPAAVLRTAVSRVLARRHLA